MGLLDRIRKKKKTPNKEPVQLTELEQLCRDDPETYEALRDAMFLDPRKVGVSLKDAVKNAKTFEKAKDNVLASLWYRIAGGLAIYEGNVAKVKKYFDKCQNLSPQKKFLILKNTEKAVTKAQEYYKKHLGD